MTSIIQNSINSILQIKSWIETIEVEVRFQVDGTLRTINSTKAVTHTEYNIVNLLNSIFRAPSISKYISKFRPQTLSGNQTLILQCTAPECPDIYHVVERCSDSVAYQTPQCNHMVERCSDSVVCITW